MPLHPDIIPITPQSHGVTIDIKYATSENFTGEPVYARAGCYLQKDAAEALAKAAELAGRMGYRLHVFDAYRPTEAQQKLWNHTPDPNFLANPERGSPHSRGVAVDLTLVDLKTDKALEMGTAFDAFTPLSHHGNTEITSEYQNNRMILLGIMTLAGWDFYRNEWWHYQLFNSREFRLFSDAEAGTQMM